MKNALLLKNEHSLMTTFSKENNTDLKWYVVHISQPGKELVLKDILEKELGKVKNITGYYCPIHPCKERNHDLNDGRIAIRRKVKVRDKTGKRKSKVEKVLPLFAGMVYVRATQTALASFLKDFFPTGTILYSNASEAGPVPVVVKDDDMKKLIDFNDNLPAEPVLLQKPFNDYAFNNIKNEPNDTVMVIDGVLAGRTGYVIRIKGNRGLAFKMKDPAGNGFLTVGVPNIRSFHIVRLHNAEIDSSTFATRKQRAVDLLVGIIQGAGIAGNNVLRTLYGIVAQLRKDASFDILAEYLRNYKLFGKAQGPAAKQKSDFIISAIKRLTADEQRLILYLVWYEEQNPGYVEENYHTLVIRPFLTPTSGVIPCKGRKYAKLTHNGFIEIIKPVSITENVFHPNKDSENNTEKETSTYYAHIGIKYLDGGYIIFANWDGFLSKYFMTEGRTNRKILCGKTKVSYARDDDGNLIRDPDSNRLKIEKKELMDSFLNYAKPLYNVLDGKSEVKAMPKLNLSPTASTGKSQPGKDSNRHTKRKYDLSVLYIKVPKPEKVTDPLCDAEIWEAIRKLIRVGLNICKTISTETHIKVWRDLLHYVWLHK